MLGFERSVVDGFLATNGGIACISCRWSIHLFKVSTDNTQILPFLKLGWENMFIISYSLPHFRLFSHMFLWFFHWTPQRWSWLMTCWGGWLRHQAFPCPVTGLQYGQQPAKMILWIMTLCNYILYSINYIILYYIILYYNISYYDIILNYILLYVWLGWFGGTTILRTLFCEGSVWLFGFFPPFYYSCCLASWRAQRNSPDLPSP
jgi:hypothetical protein